MTLKLPAVSIGIPVYNGDNYIKYALESLLDQTFRDFELVISDNASTDSTQQICQRFALLDDRVRYFRNETNRGAMSNFNRVFELARAPLFKWMAHDDTIESGYLEACIAALEQDRSAVLAHTETRIIDKDGAVLSIYESELQATESDSPASRFAPVILTPHLSMELFAVMRSSALRQTRLFSGSYNGIDKVILAELSLVGRFIRIPEPLFNNREHVERCVRAVSIHDIDAWYGGDQASGSGYHVGRLYLDYWKGLHRHDLSLLQRLRCYISLFIWWFVDLNAAHVLLEFLSTVDPRIYAMAIKVKQRLTGPRKIFRGSEVRTSEDQKSRSGQSD